MTHIYFKRSIYFHICMHGQVLFNSVDCSCHCVDSNSFGLIQIQDSQSSSDETEETRLKKLELIRYTEMLLQSVQDADFETYVKLTDPQMTCYEPEAVIINRK